MTLGELTELLDGMLVLPARYAEMPVLVDDGGQWLEVTSVKLDEDRVILHLEPF